MPSDRLEASDLLEIALSKDINLITKHDKLFLKTLLTLSTRNDPLCLKICHAFSQIQIEGDLFIETIEAAFTQIEEVLDTQIHLKEALELFDEVSREERGSGPLWFFFARSEFAKTRAFKNQLITAFPLDPSFYGEVMEKTKDLSYIPVLEKFLEVHAAYVRYLPMKEDSHEVFPPHDVWLRVGSAYVRFLKLQSKDFSPDNLIDFLSQKFFIGLPENSDEWLKNLDPEERRKFLTFHNLYFLHFEVNSDS